jgi:hypothetical protein
MIYYVVWHTYVKGATPQTKPLPEISIGNMFQRRMVQRKYITSALDSEVLVWASLGWIRDSVQRYTACTLNFLLRYVSEGYLKRRPTQYSLAEQEWIYRTFHHPHFEYNNSSLTQNLPVYNRTTVATLKLIIGLRQHPIAIKCLHRIVQRCKSLKYKTISVGWVRVAADHLYRWHVPNMLHIVVWVSSGTLPWRCVFKE